MECRADWEDLTSAIGDLTLDIANRCSFYLHSVAP